jgi:serine protease
VKAIQHVIALGFKINKLQGQDKNGALIMQNQKLLPSAISTSLIPASLGVSSITEAAFPDQISVDAQALYGQMPNETNRIIVKYREGTSIGMPVARDTSQGEAVIVAVIEPGYLEHVDLANNRQLPGYDLIGDTTTANDNNGRDADASDTGDYAPFCNINESNLYGTHVCGTIAAMTDNNTGVAFNAKVLPVRVLGKYDSSMPDIANGIIWGVSGVAAINGPDSTPTPMPDLIMLENGVAETGFSGRQLVVSYEVDTPTPSECPFPDSNSSCEDVMEWLRCQNPWIPQTSEDKHSRTNVQGRYPLTLSLK